MNAELNKALGKISEEGGNFARSLAVVVALSDQLTEALRIAYNSADPHNRKKLRNIYVGINHHEYDETDPITHEFSELFSNYGYSPECKEDRVKVVKEITITR